MSGWIFLVLSALLSAQIAVSLALYEPADGKIMFGAWVDSEDPKATVKLGLGGDSPSQFNQRLGQSAAVFHLSQSLPLAISPFDQTEQTAPLNLVENTKTDAILFLTVYPNQTATNSWDLITDRDLQKLAWQLGNITDPRASSRRVMLRYAPEFNGNWFSYGQQPTRFIKEWVRLVTAVRTVTKRVAFVWSPNAGNNYPFGDLLPSAEIQTLDTSGDGHVTFADDPFTPYYPGDAFVDWIGMSVYWKGNPSTQYPLHDNSECPSNYWEQIVENKDQTGNPKYPFYTMFAKGHNKPLVMSEGGAAFALSQQGVPGSLPIGVGQVSYDMSYWQSGLSKDTFSKYPKAKMFINFEYQRNAEDPTPGKANGITRDYRVTQNKDVLAAFQTRLQSLQNYLQWADTFVPGMDPLVIGGGQSSAPLGTNSTAAAGGGSNPSNGGNSGLTLGGGDSNSDLTAATSSQSFPVGPVVAGVIGGLVFVGIVALFLFQCRSRKEAPPAPPSDFLRTDRPFDSPTFVSMPLAPLPNASHK
ncbi:glycoside hydrolase superfamily [Chytriomyces sp. MP71]|nr:glycoside hydrolase superfamily [Chytriomyces sp. MP71]